MFTLSLRALTNFHSAGSLDSLLTNHGVQQASRLGTFFRDASITFTHIFASDLTRASKTASLIADHQPSNGGNGKVDVVRTPLIQEQHFGSYEGKPYYDVRYASALMGQDEYRRLHGRDPGFEDMESKEVMTERVDRFLEEMLLPVLHDSGNGNGDGNERPTVAVVSHGITLTYIWKRLLVRLPERSVVVHPELFPVHGVVNIQRIGGWSNTGFLAVEFKRIERTPANATAEPGALNDADPVLVDGVGLDAAEQNPASPEAQAGRIADPNNGSRGTSAPKLLEGWTTTVNTINGTLHLEGLKRTAGGIGSAAHDEKQQSLDAFFKKRNL